MFIIVERNNWDNLEIITNNLNQPKQFSCESEALDYAKEKGLVTFQILEVTI